MMQLPTEGTNVAVDAAAWDLSVPTGRGNDREEFGRAIEACRQYLLLVADREMSADLRAKGGASDLVQETFLDAQRDASRFQGRDEGELRAWLRQILMNNVSNFARRYRTTQKRRLGGEVSLDQSDAGALKAGLAAPTESPSRHAIENEQAHALVGAIQRLPEHYRQVIAWRHQEQWTFEEIGQRLGTSAPAARMVWARAIKRLQQELPGQPRPARGGEHRGEC